MVAETWALLAIETLERDIGDLWRCLEIAAADGVEPETYDSSKPLEGVRAALWRELGPDGTAVDVLTAGLPDDPAARLRTRVRALLTETVGPPS